MPDPSARVLGRRLREIRHSLPTATGKPLPQSELARRLLVGGKGSISLFESGQRIPSPDVVGRYSALVGEDPAELLRMRAAALAPLAPSHPDPDGTDSDHSPEAAQGGRRKPTRGIVATAAFSLLVVAIGGLLVVRHGPDGPVVQITEPHGSVDPVATLVGEAHGLGSVDLWVDVQAVDERRHHPTEKPCDLSGDIFSFDEIYVGNPGDGGRPFRLSVVAVSRGSSAERALVTYARRPKDTPDAYAGLTHLPSGARVVAQVVVQRAGGQE